MSEIDFSKYDVEMIHHPDENKDMSELIGYLSKILNDRSIPEENKLNIRKQYDEVMRIKNITMKPPIVRLTPKEPIPE